MQSSSTSNPTITIKFHHRQGNILIKAYIAQSAYELELPTNPQFDFTQLQKSIQNGHYTIISQTNQTLKLKIDAQEFSLISEEKTIANEFQETITSLSSNIENQFNKNAKFEAQSKRLRADLDELNQKFSKMAQKMNQMTGRIVENQKLKSQLQQVKEQLAQLKMQQPNSSQIHSPTRNTMDKSGQLISMGSQRSIKQDLNENDEQMLLDIVSVLEKRISQNQDIPTKESIEQEVTLSQSIINAFTILAKIPKIQWQEFNHSTVINTLEERSTVKNFFHKDIVSMQILYRASDEYFSARKFHEKCDKIANTLILVKTEFNQVIGGFTPLKWKSPLRQNVQNQRDKTGESFIFSLTEKQKFILINKDNAIVNKSSWGPVFGCDLVINDKANIRPNCYAKVNLCYGSENAVKGSSIVTKRILGGGPNSHFKVLDWEVWHLEFKQEKSDKSY